MVIFLQNLDALDIGGITEAFPSKLLMANTCHLEMKICLVFILKGGSLHALDLSLDLVNFLLKGLIYPPFLCHTVHGQQCSSNTSGHPGQEPGWVFL